MTPTAPDPGTPDPGPPFVDVLSFNRGASSDGAPGNTLALSAARDGDTVHMAVDNYWDRAIYVGAVENGTARSQRVPTNVDGDQYVEQLGFDVYQGTRLLTFRVGLDEVRLWRENEWDRGGGFTVVSRTKGDTLVAATPRLASFGEALFLGFGKVKLDEDPVVFHVQNFTDAWGDDGIVRSTWRELGPAAPLLAAGDLDVVGETLAVFFASGNGEALFAMGSFDNLDPVTIWSEEPLDPAHPGSIPYTRVRFDSSGVPVALVQASDSTMDDPPHEPRATFVAFGPPWDWIDPGWAIVDWPHLETTPEGALVVGRTVGAECKTASCDEYSAFLLRPDGSLESLMKASCRLSLVKHSDGLEAVALAFDDAQETYVVRWIPDLRKATAIDPCAFG